MKTDERAFDSFFSSIRRVESDCLSAFDSRVAEADRALETLATNRIAAPTRLAMARQVGLRCASDIYGDVFMSLRRASHLNAVMAADTIYAVSKDSGDPIIVDRRSIADTVSYRARGSEDGMQDWSRVWSAAADAAVKGADTADFSKLKALRWQVKHVARWQSAYLYNGAMSDFARAVSLSGKPVFKRWMGDTGQADRQVVRPDGLFSVEGTEVPYPGTMSFEPATVVPWRKGWAAPVYFVIKGQRRWVK